MSLAGSSGTYQFADLTIGIIGAPHVVQTTGLDFTKSDVQFTSANTSITGDGSAGTIGINLSESKNPNGTNSATSNILLADASGQTASISNVATGVLLGDATGSAGANFVYGNQTPESSGGSGSSISVISGGLTLDATHLTSTNSLTSGQYQFIGVAFTGNASFSGGGSDLFVGSVSAGTDDGSTALNRISINQLLTMDATPSNLNGKTIVLVNDSGSGGGTASISMGSSILTRGDNTTIDSFGNGQTFTLGVSVPVNIISDGVGSSTTIHDPYGNGAATLTNTSTQNVITLGNGDTIQNVQITSDSSATSAIVGSSITGLNINNASINGGSIATLDGSTYSGGLVDITNSTGTITLTQNAFLTAGSGASVLTNNAGTVTINGGSMDGGFVGVLAQDTNVTASNITLGNNAAIEVGVIILETDSNSHTNTLSGLTNNSPSDLQTAIELEGVDLATTQFNLSNNNLGASGSGLAIGDGSAHGVFQADSIQVSMTGTNTFTVPDSGGAEAAYISGIQQGGKNSIAFTSLGNANFLVAGASGDTSTAQGILFYNVDFNSNPSTEGVHQVVAGDWTIGQTTSSGTLLGFEGLRLENCSGSLAFNTLDVAVSGTSAVDANNMALAINGGTIDSGRFWYHPDQYDLVLVEQHDGRRLQSHDPIEKQCSLRIGEFGDALFRHGPGRQFGNDQLQWRHQHFPVSIAGA